MYVVLLLPGLRGGAGSDSVNNSLPGHPHAKSRGCYGGVGAEEGAGQGPGLGPGSSSNSHYHHHSGSGGRGRGVSVSVSPPTFSPGHVESHGALASLGILPCTDTGERLTDGLTD